MGVNVSALYLDEWEVRRWHRLRNVKGHRGVSRWPYLRFLAAYGKQARINSMKATSAFRAMTAIFKNAFIRSPL